MKIEEFYTEAALSKRLILHQRPLFLKIRGHIYKNVVRQPMMWYPKHTYRRCSKDTALCGGNSYVTTNKQVCLVRFSLAQCVSLCYFATRSHEAHCINVIWHTYFLAVTHNCGISVLCEDQKTTRSCVIHPSDHQVKWKSNPDQSEMSALQYNNNNITWKIYADLTFTVMNHRNQFQELANWFLYLTKMNGVPEKWKNKFRNLKLNCMLFKMALKVQLIWQISGKCAKGFIEKKKVIVHVLRQPQRDGSAEMWHWVQGGVRTLSRLLPPSSHPPNQCERRRRRAAPLCSQNKLSYKQLQHTYTATQRYRRCLTKGEDRRWIFYPPTIPFDFQPRCPQHTSPTQTTSYECFLFEDTKPACCSFFVAVKCGMASPNPQESIAKSTGCREGGSSGAGGKRKKNTSAPSSHVHSNQQTHTSQTCH